MGTPKARLDAYYEIIAERLTVGIPDETENAMDRGTRLEPEAITLFELETGKNVDVIGLCESDDNPNIANSPDGLIGDNEAIEVKCMGGKNHVKFWITNKIPDEYEWQIVQYFVVNDKLEKLYLVGYNPDIEIHPIHILEVGRQELLDQIKIAKEEQIKFLSEVEEYLKEVIKL